MTVAKSATIAAARAIAPSAIDRPWAQRLAGPATIAAALAVFVWFCIDLDLTPAAFGRGFETAGRFAAAMVPPSPGTELGEILQALVETLGMAVVGTALGALAAAPLGLLAARTIAPNPVFHFVLRRLLDLFRGIPALVWALILVAAFGLGPFAGVLALAFSDAPRLAKLFAEALETAEERQREALRAAGADGLMILRYGVAPQVGPVWLSQVLYMLEQNFRAAAVLGVVGAGGIGFELEERIRIFRFDEVAFIVILFMLMVGLLDWASAALRKRLA